MVRLYLPYTIGDDNPIGNLFKNILPYLSSECEITIFYKDDSVANIQDVNYIWEYDNEIIRFLRVMAESFSAQDIIHTGGRESKHFRVAKAAHFRNRNLSHIHSFRVDVDPESEFQTGRREALARMADMTVAVSEHTASSAKREFGVSPIVIYNGVDTGIFCPDYSRPPLLEPINPERCIFLFVGALTERKRPEDIIHVAESIPEAVFIAIGDGPLYDHLISKSSHLNNIKFTGYIKKNKLPAIYANSTAFLFPTVREGCPNVVLEAMAAGIPVIGYKATSMPELVTTNKTGVLVDATNVDKLTEAVRTINNSEYKAEKLGRQARSHILNNHTFDIIAQQYIKVYRNIS